MGAEQQRTRKIARKLVKNSNLAMHVGSVAIGLEALESLLIEKGVLKDEELMQRINRVAEQQYAKGNFMPVSED
jgi:hypothetical protein